MKKKWSSPNLESLNSRYTNESGMIAYYKDLSTGPAGTKGIIGIKCVGMYNSETKDLTTCGEIFNTSDEYMNHVSIKHPGSTIKVWEDVFIS